MSTTPKNTYDDQEIDLRDVSRKVGSMFQSLNTFIFNSIQFVLRNIVILVLLLIIGVGVGIYLDRTQKTYHHQIIVSPNFGSVDYLYSRVALIDSKIKERDTVFLKSIGFKNPARLAKIEIKPIVDVYKFVNRTGKELDFQLLKLLSEDGDIKKIVEEPVTSRNYTFHQISFITRNKTAPQNTVDPLLAYLNDSDYFKKIQDESLKNVRLKMEANDRTIAQIDGFMDEFAASTAGSTLKSSNLVYYNENTQLNDVIQTKNDLHKEQGYLRIEMVGFDKIIKDNTIITNIEKKDAVSGNMKLWLPLLLIFLYLIIVFFIAFYKNQLRKRQLAA